MSWHDKVIWSEGLFLRPQHFQQQTRYFEHLIEARCRDIRAHAWGILKLDFSLQEKKLVLSECVAILKDGTVVEVSKNDSQLPEMEIDQNVRNEVVFLAVPSRHQAVEAFEGDKNSKDELIRYRREKYEVRDNNAGTQSIEKLPIGQLCVRLMLESDPQRDNYTCLGIARIQKREGTMVALDDNFIPPTLDCHIVAVLANAIRDILIKVQQKGEGLAKLASDQMNSISQGIDLIILRLLNRSESLLSHFNHSATRLHPEVLYREMLQMAGELATFAHENKRPLPFPAYDHDKLQATFQPLIEDILTSLDNIETDKYAVQIPLQIEDGIHLALIKDMPTRINLPNLLEGCRFILAVKVKVSAFKLRDEFPKVIKIGAFDSTRNAKSQIIVLVNKALPGVRVEPIEPPEQLKRHADFLYFELERGSEYWSELSEYEGIAIHVGGLFKDAELELWAIKGTNLF